MRRTARCCQRVLVLLLALVLLNEWLVYHLTVAFWCTWPQTADSRESQKTIKALLLADTHLLGVNRGHWFDRLKR